METDEERSISFFSSLKRKIVRGVTKAFVRHRVEEKLDAIKDYMSEHPVIAVVVLVFAAFSALPVFMFLAFTAGSIVFMLIGFLILEGVVLTISSFFLGLALCAVGFISLFVSGFIVMVLMSASVTSQVVQYFMTNLNMNNRSATTTQSERFAKEE